MKHIPTALLASIFLLTACVRTTTATVTHILEKTPTITPVLEGVFLNECENCHTDKQRLIDTAKPEVTVEKESTGAG